MSELTYLITGAGRGIGKGILSALMTRPNTTIIAAVRDTSTATNSLSTVPVGKDSKIIIVKLDATIDTDPSTAVEILKSKHNISKIDVLLSNAGLLDGIARYTFMPLLLLSPSPKFLVITSSIGSITDMEKYPVPFFAYGISKAAANYLVRKVAFENPKVVAVAFNPGWV
ncbi:hypothetical protein IFR04_013859 [Cadophora malorum]|uniref:NAD(P)-binding protein n=1 Tax=Cadophora malorum TaxID=108018 RepID=A0A8H7T5S2_9HELO|nr:hypothetical protein IFR04_013859 [Cadophora malorum]